MLFLVVFSALALGFYAETNMSAQLANNERQANSAMVAAESGLAFLRYHIASVSVPPGLTPEVAFEELHTQLKGRLEGSGTLGSNTIGYVPNLDPSKAVINIPAAAGQYVDLGLGAGQKFRATINHNGMQIVVRVVGACGSATASPRGIEVKFDRVDNPNPIFNYGLAAQGPVTLSGGVVKGVPDASRGSVLSTVAGTAITMSGSATITGKVDLTVSSATISGSGSIGGTTTPALWPVTKGQVPTPEFPTVNPQPFIDYMVGRETLITGSASLASYSNIRIKAGCNANLSGGPTIKGVILIEAPNKVTFSGGANIQGVVVVVNTMDATSTNEIIFSGGGTMTGPEGLDASYGDLVNMTGSSILAPNFKLTMTGGSASFGGTIVAKSIGLSGGSGGTSSGSVISMTTASQTWSGGSGFTFSAGPTKKPFGVEFTGHYETSKNSYLEFKP